MNSDTQPDIQIIIPAAGSSSRLGHPKQNVHIKGVPLWRMTTQRAAVLNAPILMVTGAWQPDRPSAMSHVETCHFENWEQGMGASIAHAVNIAPTPKLGYLILLIDQWGISSHDLVDFVRKWDTESIQISTDNAYTGPPALFPVSMKEPLESLSGDAGARHLIHQHLPKRVSVPHASWDLDTPEDLFLLEQLANKKIKQEQSYDHS